MSAGTSDFMMCLCYGLLGRLVFMESEMNSGEMNYSLSLLSSHHIYLFRGRWLGASLLLGELLTSAYLLPAYLTHRCALLPVWSLMIKQLVRTLGMYFSFMLLSPRPSIYLSLKNGRIQTSFGKYWLTCFYLWTYKQSGSHSLCVGATCLVICWPAML